MGGCAILIGFWVGVYCIVGSCVRYSVVFLLCLCRVACCLDLFCVGCGCVCLVVIYVL